MRMVFAVIILLLGCVGCNNQTNLKRYVFPPFPATPVLEFEGAYASQYSLPKDSSWDKFEQKVLSVEPLSFTRPMGIYADGNGKVYVTDLGNHSVAEYDFNKKEVKPFGDENIGDFIEFPTGIAGDASGSIYISDTTKNRIFKFDMDGKFLFEMGSDIVLDGPAGMAIDNNLGRIYIANVQRHNIAVFNLSGNFLFTIGRRGVGDGEFNYPKDVDIDSSGNIVVADSMNARVQILTPEGKPLIKFGKRGDGFSDFQMIKGIAVDKKTDHVFVTDGAANKVMIFNNKGKPMLTFGGTASVSKRLYPGGFLIPQDIYIDSNGKVYIVDSLNKRFQVYKTVEGYTK